MNLLNKLISKIDDFMLSVARILFALVPVVLILGGALFLVGIPMLWYLSQNVVVSQLWYVIPCLVVIWIGFKWNDAARESLDEEPE